MQYSTGSRDRKTLTRLQYPANEQCVELCNALALLVHVATNGCALVSSYAAPNKSSAAVGSRLSTFQHRCEATVYSRLWRREVGIVTYCRRPWSAPLTAQIVSLCGPKFSSKATICFWEHTKVFSRGRSVDWNAPREIKAEAKRKAEPQSPFVNDDPPVQLLRHSIAFTEKCRNLQG